MERLPVTLDSRHIAVAKAWFGANSRESAVIERAERAGLGRVDAQIVERVEAVLRTASQVSWEYFGWDDIYRETFEAFEDALTAMQRGGEPELAKWKDVLPQTRVELYAVLAIFLTVLSILANQAGSRKHLTESEAETLVRNAVREALHQVQSQSPSAPVTGPGPPSSTSKTSHLQQRQRPPVVTPRPP
jgi:hypothetical protein